MSNTPNGLPTLPSAAYSLELATTHLWHDRALTGSRNVVTSLMNQAALPGNLREPYDNWHMGGHLGEIGKTALVMDRADVPPAKDRLDAVHRSAVLMTVLRVANTVATELPYCHREFFDNTRDALLTGSSQTPVSRGPAQQKEAYAYAQKAGEWLKFGTEQKDKLGQLFEYMKVAWLKQRAESVPHRRNPEALLAIVKEIGTVSTQMAAVAVLGHEGHPALEQLGAIGGIEEHGPTVARGGLETYASALVRTNGRKHGEQLARDMRVREETELYRAAQSTLVTKRQRQIFRTVTFFAITPWSHP
jgi:hypothetical protein